MTFNSPQPISTKANMIWNSAGSLIYFGFQWLMTVAIVRLSNGYDEAGVLALAMAVYNTFQPLAVYRINTYQVSDVDHENTLGEYMSFRFITLAAALICSCVYATVTCPSSSVVAIVLYVLYKMCTLMIDILHGTNQLNGRMDYSGISSGLQGIVSFAVFVGVFALTANLAITFFCMAVSIALIGVIYDIPRTRKFEALKLGISFSKMRHLLIYCLPVVLATIACSACPLIPRQYLALTQGEAALGVYASIAAPAAIIQMGANYIFVPLLGFFAMHYNAGDRKAFLKLFVKTLIGVIAFSCIAGIMLFAFGPWFFGLLFGPSIDGHLYLLPPIIFMTGVTALVWFSNDLLVSMRRFFAMTISCFVGFLVAMSLMMILINTFGANGISFTAIVSYGVAFLIGVSFVLVSIFKLEPIKKM